MLLVGNGKGRKVEKALQGRRGKKGIPVGVCLISSVVQGSGIRRRGCAVLYCLLGVGLYCASSQPAKACLPARAAVAALYFLFSFRKWQIPKELSFSSSSTISSYSLYPFLSVRIVSQPASASHRLGHFALVVVVAPCGATARQVTCGPARCDARRRQNGLRKRLKSTATESLVVLPLFLVFSSFFFPFLLLRLV